MTTPRPVVRLRREQLARLAELPSPAARVLLALIVHACPVTGRAWLSPERIAELLSLPPITVGGELVRLSELGFLDDYPTLYARMRCIELGDVFVRDRFAPENLPVDGHAEPRT